MKSLFASKRSLAILGISIIAIGIGAISKKVISYPAGECIKDEREITFKNNISNYFIWGPSFPNSFIINFINTL